MTDLALDPSETCPPASAAPPHAGTRPAGLRWGRLVLFGGLGLAGTGAFASVASTYLAGLAGPQRASVAIRQRAADWPDLKDGLPALATGSFPAAAVRETAPAEPVRLPTIQARDEPARMPDGPVLARSDAPAVVSVASTALRGREAGPEAAVAPAARPLPAIVDVPVIGAPRQVSLVPPARAVPAMNPLPAETVRARTQAAAFAALAPEPAKPEPAKPDLTTPEPVKAKPRPEPHAKPPVAEKAVARKPAAVEAKAAPPAVEAQDEDAEVFGIKVPSLAPAGRKFRESVEALGDAVKGLPDRF